MEHKARFIGPVRAAVMVWSFLWALPAAGIFVDGKGHYALRGESRQSPAFRGGSAFQAIDQFFRLETEFRTGDKSSFITEFTMFDEPRSAYLGDSSEPSECSDEVTTAQGSKYPAGTGNRSDCVSRNQNSIEPGYRSYTPKIRKAYARYASDTCLFTVGRRGRDWGLGMFLDSGEGTFDTAASIYDGVTCDINVQKSQTFGFSVGYDKISEAGMPIDLVGKADESFGPKNQGDDLDQIFFTMEYDTTKGEPSAYSQKVGIYFANIMGADPLKTDIKLADLYVGFFMPNFTIQNEILFRLGKSADPNFTRLGGQASIAEDIVRNDVQSIALAGRVDWFMSRSGSLKGPKEHPAGDLTSHALFFEYAYAPGDKDGYLEQFQAGDDITRLRTDNKASAVAMHRNFKPALILFNGRMEDDGERIDGIFDPGRVMNATVMSVGYEYKSREYGKFNLKLVTAQLNEGITQARKDTYAADLAADAEGDLVAPIGYAGKDLGMELDLTYEAQYDHGFYLGGALGMAVPGSAWDVVPNKDPKTQFLIQAHASFHF